MADSLYVAYQSFQQQLPGSLDRLAQAVYEFALPRLRRVRRDVSKAPEIFETPEDWAQDVTLAVLKHLDTTRTPARFYKYVEKSVENRGKKAFDDLIEARDTQLPFMTTSDNDEAGSDLKVVAIENPLVHSQQNESEPSFSLPNWLSDVERRMFGWLLTAMSHAEIAEVMDMTEASVSKTISRVQKAMRDRSNQARDVVKLAELEKRKIRRRRKELEIGDHEALKAYALVTERAMEIEASRHSVPTATSRWRKHGHAERTASFTGSLSARPGPIDFLIDVQLAARKVLTASECRQCEQLCDPTDLSVEARIALGREFIRRGIHPASLYFNQGFEAHHE